jgi:uncharacterized protein
MILTIFDHIFFFLLCFVMPGMAILSDKSSQSMEEEMGGIDEAEIIKMHFPSKKHIYYTNGMFLIIGALLIIALWIFNNRPLVDLGFISPSYGNMVILHALALIIIYVIDTFTNYQNHKNDLTELKKLDHIMPTTWQDYRHFIFLAIAAGVCEEIIFRGFLMNYVQQSMVNSEFRNLVTLVLPALAFSLGHIYQGIQSVFKIFAISLLFGAVYMYSGSLYIVIVIHVAIDLLSGGVLVALNQKANTNS